MWALAGVAVSGELALDGLLDREKSGVRPPHTKAAALVSVCCIEFAGGIGTSELREGRARMDVLLDIVPAHDVRIIGLFCPRYGCDRIN